MILFVYASVYYVPPNPYVSITSISISSFPYDFKVYRQSHNPFVHECIVGETLNIVFFNNTLFKNRLFPVRYLPTIVMTPSGFLILRKNYLVS